MNEEDDSEIRNHSASIYAKAIYKYFYSMDGYFTYSKYDWLKHNIENLKTLNTLSVFDDSVRKEIENTVEGLVILAEKPKNKIFVA